MQATKRYALVAALGLVIILFKGFEWLWINIPNDALTSREHSSHEDVFEKYMSRNVLQNLQSFSDRDYYYLDEDSIKSPAEKHKTRQRVYKNRKCRMESCFDFNICRRRGFKIYVYPDSGEKVSANYESILNAIKASRYYTNNPEQACLFVLSFDTLDRDPLSKDYIHNLGNKISRLKYWNNGRNHVIFNLYSGTWPDYLEEVGFNLGEAILAKASFSDTYYRTGFDVSLPLFGKTHPSLQGPGGLLKSNYFPPRRKYLLTFKGKRYTYGIGSNTRNALYHIHNGDDIIMLTTCKHGRNWQDFSDGKCGVDNEEYEKLTWTNNCRRQTLVPVPVEFQVARWLCESRIMKVVFMAKVDKWDYQQLLHNSTFCMVPRGRRLGSFRFLESLQAACIPIVLANGWMLPFAEVIDWPSASVVWEERLLLQVPTMLRNIDDDAIMSFRHKSQFLWEKYFSSVDVIVKTTFEIIHDRIFPEKSRPAFSWNQEPGALFYLPSYSRAALDYPFYYDYLGTDVPQQFTAVIQAVTPVTGSSSPLVKLVKNLILSDSCTQIVIVWHCGKPPPPSSRWETASLESGKEIIVIDDQPKVMSRRFHLFPEIRNSAIFSLDDDAMFNVQEIDFAFQVWKTFPDRIVGFPARNHYWDENASKWVYTSKWSNSYSMVLTGAAFIHKYYFALYSEWLPSKARALVDEKSNCEDILMNMLVAHVTRHPPIKVTQKKQYKNAAASKEAARLAPSGGVITQWSDPKHFGERQNCMAKFVEWFGYMPLLSTLTRFDPSFYKDNVSITRKRYPKIEI